MRSTRSNLLRGIAVNGRINITFTPLDGLTNVVLSFLPKEFRPVGLDEEEWEEL